MSSELFVKLREIYIHIFKKKILMVEKNKTFVSNKSIIIPLNLFYFCFIKDLLENHEINLVCELDGLIFYNNYKNNKITINLIMLEANIIDPRNPNKKNNFTETINKYSKSTPIFIIVKLENLDIYLNIQLVLMNMTKIITKEFQLSTILNKQLNEILM